VRAVSVRREEIVEIAKELFAARGYAATSMREIADAAGVLSGSLYSHFRSKAQILELAIMPFYARLHPEQDRAARAGTTGAERLEALLRVTLDVCEAHRTEMTILHYGWPSLRDIDDLAVVIDASNESLDLWHRVITEGVSDGSLRPTLHPETASRMVTSAISGLIDRQRYANRPDLVRERTLPRLTEDLVTLLTVGLNAPRTASPAAVGAG
jgi:AcrR family transcriptional regulator